MQEKKFVTIFPACENVHLTTEIGQIPYFMYKVYGYDSMLVCYKNNEEYPSLEDEVKGLKLVFLANKGKVSFVEKQVVSYIWNQAKNIAVLNLYHFSKFTFVYGILYKIRNPKGFLFLKLDAYNNTFAEGTSIRHSPKKLKNTLLKWLEHRFLKKVDFMVIENSEGEKLVKKMYPAVSSKVRYLPVGVNDLFLSKVFSQRLKKFAEKENIILSIGRVGEEIKNHKMILRALTQTNLKDWKMVFVGPVNEDFKHYFETLCLTFPVLSEKVLFTGRIRNRSDLYEWYNRSKIFCMTSWHESFCHAIGEAFYFGNYIIGTEGIMSMKDITDSGKYGITLKADDDQALAASFQKLIDDEAILKERYPAIIAHSRKNFVWSNIIDKIQDQIQKK